MTVSQCVTQALPVPAEAAVVTTESGKTGMRQPDLFNSIFAGLFESVNPSLSEQTEDGGNSQSDVKTGKEMNGNSVECMAMLFQPVKDAFAMRIQTDPGMEEAEPTARDTNVLSVVSVSSVESAAGKVDAPDEEIVTEKTPAMISENTGIPAGILQATGTAVLLSAQRSIVTDPTESKDARWLTAEKPRDVEVPNLKKEMSNVQVTDRPRNFDAIATGKDRLEPTLSQVEMPDAGYPDMSSRMETETGLAPLSGEMTSPDESIANSSEANPATAQRVDTILQPKKDLDLPHAKQQLFEIASTEGKGGNEQVVATGMEDNRDFSRVRTQHHGKHDENGLQTPQALGVNDPEQSIRTEKPESSGKSIDFDKIEVTFGDSSAPGDFSEKSGESPMNSPDNGKGNIKFADVNSGMRSTEISTQTQAQSQNAVSEPSRPVSHEQILSQVREKLAGQRSNGDSSRITMRLNPEQLGELQVNMKMENQRLKVEIIAENQTVKEALMQNMDSLKETLSRQNIAMERFNVLTGGGGGSGESYRDWRHTGQNAQPNPFMRFSGFSEDTSESNISYLDSAENSMVDLRL